MLKAIIMPGQPNVVRIATRDVREAHKTGEALEGELAPMPPSASGAAVGDHAEPYPLGGGDGYPAPHVWRDAISIAIEPLYRNEYGCATCPVITGTALPRRRWLRDALALPPFSGSAMSKDQIRQLNALAHEFKYARAENVRRKAEIEAGVARANQQLASARELLAKLNVILKSDQKISR